MSSPSRKRRPLSNGRSAPWVGQFINLPSGMIKSPQFRALSPAAVKLFLELCARYCGTKSPPISLGYAEAASLLRVSKATAMRASRQLEAYGFIKTDRVGHFTGRTASTWFLTFKEFRDRAISDDWKSFQAPPKRKGKKRKANLIADIANSEEFSDARKERMVPT